MGLADVLAGDALPSVELVVALADASIGSLFARPLQNIHTAILILKVTLLVTSLLIRQESFAEQRQQWKEE